MKISRKCTGEPIKVQMGFKSLLTLSRDQAYMNDKAKMAICMSIFQKEHFYKIQALVIKKRSEKREKKKKKGR
jgi:hypothetical protein